MPTSPVARSSNAATSHPRPDNAGAGTGSAVQMPCTQKLLRTQSAVIAQTPPIATGVWVGVAVGVLVGVAVGV
jgi:hypothetical protein